MVCRYAEQPYGPAFRPSKHCTCSNPSTRNHPALFDCFLMNPQLHAEARRDQETRICKALGRKRSDDLRLDKSERIRNEEQQRLKLGGAMVGVLAGQVRK